MAGKQDEREHYVFIVRLWREPAAEAIWRGSVETIPSVGVRYFADLPQLNHLLTDTLLNPSTSASKPAAEPDPGKQ